MSINKGIFPGTFTMGNVVCGFLAILSAFEGNMITACWLIILAAFLDVLDGKVARLAGSSSQFGVELDSLADFLSFGVAPAVVVYAVHINHLGKWGWLISAVYIMAASYRLARFNLLAATDEKKDFVGLPVPMAAVPLVAYIIFSDEVWGTLEYGQVLISMIVLLSVLMVSQVNYDAMPDNFHTRANRWKLIVVIVAGAAILFRPRLLLFPFCAAYILWGMVRDFYMLFHRKVSGVAGRRNVRRKKGRNLPDGSEE